MLPSDYDEQFAALYDTFYRSRNVAGEARYASDLLALDCKPGSPRRVLDFGCGTGSHAVAFGRQGLHATGFDISPAMIQRARCKLEVGGVPTVRFETGAFSDFCNRLNGDRFDGAVSMFNVFNCMGSASTMLEQLRLVRKTLAAGASFLVEVWNGVAVLTDEPRPHVRHCDLGEDNAREVVRITLPELDRINQVCTLRYRVLTLDRVARTFNEFESVHELRFLTPVQYRHLFGLADLTVVDEFPKGRPGTPVSENDWHISYLVHRDS